MTGWFAFHDAEKFRSEFNFKNTATTTPNWYMKVEGEPSAIAEAQFLLLKQYRQIWKSELEAITQKIEE